MQIYNTGNHWETWTDEQPNGMLTYKSMITKLEYVPGKTNTVADGLSLPADADQGQEDNKNITVLA